MVAQVTDTTFGGEVLKATTPVLVDFFATWCGPCKAVAPIVDELSKQYTGKLKVVKVDVDQSPQTAAQFGITGVPTLIVFSGGKEASRMVGAQPKDRLVKGLAQFVK